MQMKNAIMAPVHQQLAEVLLLKNEKTRIQEAEVCA
jgi:hypothetical protein